MKVCYYNHTGKVSGAEKVLFTLLAKMGTGFESSLIAPESSQVRAFCLKHGIRHLPVRELRARFTINPLRLIQYGLSVIRGILQVRALVKDLSPDLVHANSTRAGMVAFLATIGSGTPVVWHVHDQFRRHPISSAIRFLLAASRRNSVVAVSQATAQDVRGKSDSIVTARVAITVIYNGVDVSLFREQPGAVDHFLQAENLADAPFRAVIVGQITPRKGQLGVIQTFARLVYDYSPRAQLLIVGSPVFNDDENYLHLLRSEVERLGIDENVRFMGHRSDVSVILQSSHLLIVNSSSEPFGLVLLEACACATPVLAATVDGVPELIVDGVTGKLFPPGNLDAMLSAMKLLHNDREYAKNLGIAARERTLRHFSEQLFLEQMRQYYYSVVPGSANTPPGAVHFLQAGETGPNHLFPGGVASGSSVSAFAVARRSESEQQQ
jgi:glycosyltransferase involved in cell wall biosynthesis